MAEAVKGHGLTLEDRRKSRLTGIKGVASYDEREIFLETAMGGLVLRGEGFNITHLDVEHGELEVTGQFTALVYDDKKSGKSKIWQRLWK